MDEALVPKEPALRLVHLHVCADCLAGRGGECHVPGCAFWMKSAPDVPLEPEPFDGGGGGGCLLAGPGRGDCTNYPPVSIPGQHGGADDTVDVYGKPNGWCWACWRSMRISTLESLGQNLADRLAMYERQLETCDTPCTEGRLTGPRQLAHIITEWRAAGRYSPKAGAEAEELRRELEVLVAGSETRNGAEWFDAVRAVLDGVDARDSLRWVEERLDLVMAWRTRRRCSPRSRS